VRVLDTKTLYEKLAVRGIQDDRRAAGLYEETARRDGYVSLEVSPFLAHALPHARPIVEANTRSWRVGDAWQAACSERSEPTC